MNYLRPAHLCLCVILFVAFSLLPAHGQIANRPAIPDQITQAVDPSQLQVLPNHHPLWANSANDLGFASSDLTLMMVLQRSPQQEAALQQLLADQKNPSSPDFHHWLTPTEFGQRFGLSANDLQSIRTWIESQGLTVRWIAPGGNFIGFSGPAATVGRAFATTVHNYRVHGDQRTSVSSDPMIPATLAPVVESIHGLYTIPDKPSSSITAPQTATPDFNLSNGVHFIVPGDFNTIYDGIVSASGYQQSIGIVGRSRTDPADFTNFKQLTVSNFQTPTEIIPTAFSGVDPGPALTAPPAAGTSIGEQLEATLDVTRAGTVAPNASLLLVVSKATQTIGGIDVDTQYLVQTTPIPAQIINISYGDCESDAGQSGVNFWDTLFQQAAAEGITVFVSSGDSGASGCEIAFAPPVATPPAISPNYICSSSYATCVGGTEFNDTTNTSTYWGASNGTNLASAAQYIPEGGWNEPLDSNSKVQLASSGGGVSSFIATPGWQTGPGVPSTRAGRYTPDLSFSASCHDAYFGCMAAGGGDCVVTNGSFRFFGMCGTSAASPSMAGVAALLDEKLKYSVGNMNPQIYAMAQNQPSSFHDATPTTSGVATCEINTPSMCNNSTPGPTGLTGGQAGYALTTGFDLVTGVGSPDIANFLNNFATALPVPTVTVTPSATSITPAQSLTLTVTVAGPAGQPTPTGSVILSLGSAYTSSPSALVNGNATFTIAAGTLAGSTDTDIFTAQYTPDLASSAVYGHASGTCNVAVTLTNPTLTMSSSPGTVTTAQDLFLTVTVAGPSSLPTPTGTVFINSVVSGGGGYTASGTLSGGSVTIDIPPGVFPAGSDRFDSTYQPDATGGKYYFSTLGSLNVTVTAAPKTNPAITTTLSSSTIALNDSITVTFKVAGPSGSPTPTGTVSLTGNGRTLTTPLAAGAAQITAPAGWIPVGLDTLTLAYSGDSNYNPASTTSTVTVNKGVPNIALSLLETSITSADSLDVSFYVTGPLGAPTPTGTVIISSGTYASATLPVGPSPTIFTIASGSLPLGTDTVTATYSGDGNYAATTATAPVTVTAPPTFTIGATAVTISSPGATTGNTSTVTVTPANGLIGSVSLSAQVTTSPAGAQDPPTLSFGATIPVTITGAAAGTATLTVTTTAPTTGAVIRPHSSSSRWLPIGETALAGIVLFGLRTRRGRWRAILGCVLLLVAFSSAIAACGGGGSSNPPPANPGTTPGTYVVTINASAGVITTSTTVNVVVQ